VLSTNNAHGNSLAGENTFTQLLLALFPDTGHLGCRLELSVFVLPHVVRLLISLVFHTQPLVANLASYKDTCCNAGTWLLLSWVMWDVAA